ncbi:tRNA lysidine(34) synthetase TilS [Pseudoduganella namucuonensis]|uniref:tRNA(Ile)-lysidine synthase n=1 Tax=Pseudoduganella namucuonensis TaxID=1035707 RepID=A0A1I7K5D3_9BURK|nr:tRNA lysidine(34) synthetase TilS [Pseudoduganella namucuonensis]SFU92641.1 tRNA(Ile)-lysidine synthase [Pseudoduganella namucuonensis]
MKKQQTATPSSIFAASLAGVPHEGRVAVALSGGLDSSVLLHLAQAYAKERGIGLYAFHVHHGISPNADAWQAHCAQECAALGVTFEARHITLQTKERSGTEAAARKQRYAALGALCREHGVNLLLTAHHQDDQAETVLLQLLRGSGTAGLSGMDAANTAPELLANPALTMARPLLTASRKQLEAYAATHGIQHIEDESNADTRYARNALRHTVMPALARHFPGFQERFARSAQHAQSAQRLLNELAEQDLKAALEGDSVDIGKLRDMSVDRCYNLLRHWFSVKGLSMPSTAWLHEMLAQLLEARYDAQLLVVHPEVDVRRHRDRLYLAPRLPELEGTREDRFDDAPGQDFRWDGETSIAFPNYGGVLHIEEAERGVDADWLRGQYLTIEFRRGGERLKLAENRPTRALKYHYQALNIPAWERTRLPVVKAPGQLLFAAGIGMDCHQTGQGGGKRMVFRWEAK